MGTALDRIAPRRPKNYHAKLVEWGGGSGGDMASGAVSGVAYPQHLNQPRNAEFLRNWPQTNVWIYSTLSMRCHQVCNADFDIVQIDRAKTASDELKDEILTLLTRPNAEGREKSWRLLMGPVTYDLSTLDAGVVQKMLTAAGQPDALKMLDGARMLPDPNWDGGTKPRYLYLDKSGIGTGKPFFDDEIIFMQSNPMTYTHWGLSPLQVLYKILMAEYHAFQSMYVTQRNRAPGGILVIPNSSPETIETIKDLLLNELSGMSGVGVMDVPPDSKFMPISSINLQEQGAFAFYDMLIKAIATAFRTTTLALNWLQETARATAREQAELMDDGLVSLLELIQDYINTEIIPTFPNSENLQFRFLKLASRDEAQQAKTLRERMGAATNWMALREARAADGLKEIEPKNEWERRWLEEPFVPAGTGLSLPYSVAAEQYAPQPALAGGSPSDLAPEAGTRGPNPGVDTGGIPSPDTMPVNIRRLAQRLAQLPPGGVLMPDEPHFKQAQSFPALTPGPQSGEEEVRVHEQALVRDMDDLFAEQMALTRTDIAPPHRNGANHDT